MLLVSTLANRLEVRKMLIGDEYDGDSGNDDGLGDLYREDGEDEAGDWADNH